MNDVRTLLKLDLGYYSTGNTSWLQEKIHQLKVAGKQVLSKPSTILAVTRRLGLKGILLVQQRRILLDTDQPKPKLRWNEAHEITHDVLPWHEDLAHGDPEQMLLPSCHEQIEAEANYGAGRLLFCGQEFIDRVRSSSLSFELIKDLTGIFGNTMTTTLWRIVEATNHSAFGFISVHPANAAGNTEDDIRYFISSPKFASQFKSISITDVFLDICSQCHGRRGPIGQGNCVIADDNGVAHQFMFETFWNSHDALTFAHCP
jgi:hypothetical protein